MTITATDLGSADFRRLHAVRLAYVAGSMYRGISSPDLVVRMGAAGMLSFLGTGGMGSVRLAGSVDEVQRRLGPGGLFGVNLLSTPAQPSDEDEVVDLCLSKGIDALETSAFVAVQAPMVRYRLTGLTVGPDGGVIAPHRLFAKVSRPEVARAFLEPPPESLVRHLRETERITAEEADLAHRVPMADAITAEADSGGHTDQRPALTLLPDIVRLRDRSRGAYGYHQEVSVGAAGGLGTPEAVAAAFLLGADYVVTGSVNQCTVEADTSDLAKDMLAGIGTADTVMAPAGDMFQEGAKVQVVKKGTFFAPRARKLFDLYQQHGSWGDLLRADPRTARQIEEKYLGCTFEESWRETCDYYAGRRPEEISRAELDPKRQLALVFRRYFSRASSLAHEGDEAHRVNFQIQCGPALGAFNEWVRGTPRESWRARHVDEVATMLMDGAAEVLSAASRRYAGVDHGCGHDIRPQAAAVGSGTWGSM